jgi:hypothetical protein
VAAPCIATIRKSAMNSTIRLGPQGWKHECRLRSFFTYHLWHISQESRWCQTCMTGIIWASFGRGQCVVFQVNNFQPLITETNVSSFPSSLKGGLVTDHCVVASSPCLDVWQWYRLTYIPTGHGVEHLVQRGTLHDTKICMSYLLL